MPQPIVAEWCLLIAGLMPMIATAVAKSGKAFDNADPRNEAAFDTPLRRRANGAQYNSFEAYGLFAAAVLLAVLRAAPAGLVDNLAVLWVVLRVGYIAAYVRGAAMLRSLLWFGALFTAIAIFVVALTR